MRIFDRLFRRQPRGTRVTVRINGSREYDGEVEEDDVPLVDTMIDGIVEAVVWRWTHGRRDPIRKLSVEVAR